MDAEFVPCIMVVVGLGGGGNGELFNGYKVSVFQYEYILETCCTTSTYSKQYCIAHLKF